jgi:uncharacterized protein YegL
MAARYIRCSQGHVFDRLLSDQCPRCGERATPAEQSEPARKAEPQKQGAEAKGAVRRPGGELYARPLHFFWIVDCSGSMLVANKMASVNYAIRSVIPEMRQAADDNPNVQFLMRVISFSNGAQWHIKDPMPLAEFTWSDLMAKERAVTDLGLALSLVTEEIASPPMPARALPPVLVLLTDGQATDDFYGGLGALLNEQGGQKAVRIAIAIGADADIAGLEKFCSEGTKPLRAHNATDIVQYIKWVSTVLVGKRDGVEPDLSTPPRQDDGPLLW